MKKCVLLFAILTSFSQKNCAKFECNKNPLYGTGDNLSNTLPEPLSLLYILHVQPQNSIKPVTK